MIMKTEKIIYSAELGTTYDSTKFELVNDKSIDKYQIVFEQYRNGNISIYINKNELAVLIEKLLEIKNDVAGT